MTCFRKTYLILPLIQLCFCAFLCAYPVQASETNGVILDESQYAWGENIGWLNFKPASGSASVTDVKLSGYAWNDIVGWINLSPSASVYVANDGEGDLSGYAWSSTLGWIDFDGVSIGSDGVFTGYASVESDSSQISFNCTNTSSCASASFRVETDWRPASLRIASEEGGGGGGGGGTPASAPTATPANTQDGNSGDIQDIIKDGIVDVIDFNQLMIDWNSGQCGIASDLNGDCSVNILDFNSLLILWGTVYTL